MASRPELHERLINEASKYLPINIAAGRIYFQPTKNTQLFYPCILYRLSNFHTKNADNKPYLKMDCYTVTVIDRDPDSKLRDIIAELPYCRMGTPFVNDNLYHYPFTLYW